MSTPVNIGESPKCFTCGTDCFPPLPLAGESDGALDLVDYRWYCAIHKKDRHYPRPLSDSDEGLPLVDVIRRDIDREIIDELVKKGLPNTNTPS